jgi:hypothetical protein
MLNQISPKNKNWLVVRVNAVRRYFCIIRPLLSCSAAVRVDVALNHLLSRLDVFVVPVSRQNFSMLNASSYMNLSAKFSLNHRWFVNIVDCNRETLIEFVLRGLYTIV